MLVTPTAAHTRLLVVTRVGLFATSVLIFDCAIVRPGFGIRFLCFSHPSTSQPRVVLSISYVDFWEGVRKAYRFSVASVFIESAALKKVTSMLTGRTITQ